MQRRFDLERDALVRVTVFRIGESRYQVVWSYHHLLLDGWCLSLVYQDLTRIYAALLQGLPPELPDVPAYSNYIRWLEESDRERAVGYWREAIGDYEHTAAVPRLPDADSSGGYELEQHFLSFDETASAGLAEIAARYGVSLNTLVQAVWAVLLSRYNDLDDVVFGAIVSGRPAGLQGVEEMIGLFINAIPVRVQIGKE